MKRAKRNQRDEQKELAPRRAADRRGDCPTTTCNPAATGNQSSSSLLGHAGQQAPPPSPPPAAVITLAAPAVHPAERPPPSVIHRWKSPFIIVRFAGDPTFTVGITRLGQTCERESHKPGRELSRQQGGVECFHPCRRAPRCAPSRRTAAAPPRCCARCRGADTQPLRPARGPGSERVQRGEAGQDGKASHEMRCMRTAAHSHKRSVSSRSHAPGAAFLTRASTPSA